MGEIFLATGLPARIRREGLAIAAVLVAVLAAAALLRSGPGDGLEEAYAQDFLNRAVQDDAIHAPDPATVSSYFLREMGIGVRPVMLEEGRLTRAMVCLLEKRRAAMVEYAIGGHVVAHYRVPNEPGKPTGELPLRSRSERGVNIVTWRDATFEHALVSNLSADELSALASTFSEG
jgi:anti-sigma factor RsiW